MRIDKEKLTELILEKSSGRISNRDAEDISCHVMNIFGYHSAIPDIIITPYDRQVFNTLLDLEILTLGNIPISDRKIGDRVIIREKNYLLVEIPYWFLKPKETKNEKQIKNQNIYDSLPDDVWERN